jgi:hypothetical protein
MQLRTGTSCRPLPVPFQPRIKLNCFNGEREALQAKSENVARFLILSNLGTLAIASRAVAPANAGLNLHGLSRNSPAQFEFPSSERLYDCMVMPFDGRGLRFDEVFFGAQGKGEHWPSTWASSSSMQWGLVRHWRWQRSCCPIISYLGAHLRTSPTRIGVSNHLLAWPQRRVTSVLSKSPCAGGLSRPHGALRGENLRPLGAADRGLSPRRAQHRPPRSRLRDRARPFDQRIKTATPAAERALRRTPASARQHRGAGTHRTDSRAPA